MAKSFLAGLPSLLAMTDEQAMWRVKMQDDPQAFARLVERWEKPIQGLCTRMTGDPHRGEDLAQETFARLFARRQQYEPSGRFSTYLWRIALNLCYDELRRIQRRGEISLDEQNDEAGENSFADDGRSPDNLAVEQERAEAVRRALLQLAEPYRVVVVLRHYEGLKFREIGEVLDVPEGTVKSRMAEALNQLHLLLNPFLHEAKEPTNRPRESLLI
jgi:RNA polymerase sigma-70 factor (ECF subfamily)